MTGAGNDILSANAGQIVGNSFLRDGDDQLLLSGEAVYSGKVYFGAGTGIAALSDDAYFVGNIDFDGNAGSLSIADNAIFYGTLTGAENASVDVSGGAFGPNGVKTINLGSLRVGAGGTLNAYVDGATGTSSLITADSATFESGAII